MKFKPGNKAAVAVPRAGPSHVAFSVAAATLLDADPHNGRAMVETVLQRAGKKLAARAAKSAVEACARMLRGRADNLRRRWQRCQTKRAKDELRKEDTSVVVPRALVAAAAAAAPSAASIVADAAAALQAAEAAARDLQAAREAATALQRQIEEQTARAERYEKDWKEAEEEARGARQDWLEAEDGWREAREDMDEMAAKYEEIMQEHADMLELLRSLGLEPKARAGRQKKPTPELSPQKRSERLRALSKGFQTVFDAIASDADGEFVPVVVVLRGEEKTMWLRLTPDERGRRVSEEPPPEVAAARGVEVCDTARRIVAAMDATNMSTHMYQEVAAIVRECPRSHVVDAARHAMNDEAAAALPVQLLHKGESAKVVGVRVEFERKLQYVLGLLIAEGKVKEGQKVTVKLSGDGRPASRAAGHVMLTFSILEEGQDVWKPDHNYTIALFEGREEYDRLKEEFEKVQEVVDKKKVDVNGVAHEVKYVMSADWKFLQVLFGARCWRRANECALQVLSRRRATTFACGAGAQRTIYPISQSDGVCSGASRRCPAANKHAGHGKTCAPTRPVGIVECRTCPVCTWTAWKKCAPWCCVSERSLQVVPDVLHLLLRVADYLMESVIDLGVEAYARRDKTAFLRRMEHAMDEIGVGFRFYETQEKTKGARFAARRHTCSQTWRIHL